MMDVKELSKKYLGWMLRLAFYTYIISRIVIMSIGAAGYLELHEKAMSIFIPLVISVLFVALTSLLFAWLWRVIAKNSPESLTTFYNASSGLRMLLALAVLTAYYLIEGQEMMMPMALTFMTMYFLQLIVHSFFFTKYLK